MPQIIIASTNPHKISKIKKIVEPYFSDVKSLLDYPNIEKIEENGATFAENARLKACSIAKQLNLTVIATDGGATIPALGQKWNALYTRRFIGENKSDEDRVDAMLRMMKGKKDRRVWFTEAYALCDKEDTLLEFEIKSPVGTIKKSWDGRMKEGAWLLSLWYLPNRKKDFFDLTPDEISDEENNWAILKEKLDNFFTE